LTRLRRRLLLLLPPLLILTGLIPKNLPDDRAKEPGRIISLSTRCIRQEYRGDSQGNYQ